ncbi:phage tailspike polysaccharide lyase family protein [Achromobacter xylosoxidans]|uniref:phage tailspike polysaccharide lyase family protein n=1 Tax=Alcaligenes xylosoxydans xylosoxydans TaxID=85698 RepID=UPI000B492C08|nr:hypothetical protein [Achromobacter xylosoxidans]
MTVPAQLNPRTVAVGNGVTTQFNFGFLCVEGRDLTVTIDGAPVAGSQYTVSGLGLHQGGSVTFFSAPAAGAQIVMALTVVLSRSTDYQDNGDLFAQTVNLDFDRIWLALQSTNWGLGRALRLGLFDIDGYGSYRANNNRIQDLGDPIGEQDAVNLRVLLEKLAGLATDGSGQFVLELLAQDSGTTRIGYRSTAPDAVAQTLQSVLDPFVTPYTFGAVGNGIANDTVAMQRFGLAQGRRKVLPPGRFKVTQMITFRPGDIVEGSGALSVIDASGASSWTGHAVVTASGELTPIANLSGNVLKGDDSIPLVSAANVAAGDSLVLYSPADFSWSGWRAQYRAGEFVRVHSVSGLNVKLMASLYDSYSAAGLSVHKLVGAQTVFRDFVVLAPAREIVGVHMALIDRPIMSNVWSTGALGASLEFERCVDIRFDGSAYQTQTPTNDEYGLSIANCHGGVITGPSFDAGRHGIAIGGYDRVGAVTNRAISIYVARMGNSAPIGAQDIHGNAEDIRFFGGTFQNGGIIAGQDMKFFGCTFKGRQNGSGIAIYSGEPRGGSFEFSGCTFEALTNPNASGYGIIDLGNITDKTRAICKFKFNDCLIKAPNTTQYAVGLNLSNAAFRVQVSFVNTDLECAGLTHFLRMSASVVGTNVERVTIGGIHNLASGAEYVANTTPANLSVARYTLPRQNGVVSIPGVTTSNNSSGGVTFNHPYPIPPRMITFKADGTTLGGAAFIPDVQGVSGTAATINATTSNGSNFPNTNTGTVGWEAVIEQH